MAVRFSHFVPVENPAAPSQPSFQAKARQKTAPASLPPARDHVQLSTRKHPPAIKFGSGHEDDDVTFSKLFKMGKQLAKKTYKKAKEKAKKELEKPGSEKKAAALAGGIAFVAAEAATGFSSLGVAGATAASAASGYVLTKEAKKHEQKKHAQQSPPPHDEHDSDSES